MERLVCGFCHYTNTVFQGRDAFDAKMHTLLLHSVILCLAATLIEMCFADVVVAGMARAGACLLQGAWLCTIGIVLYPADGRRRSMHEGHDMVRTVCIGNTVTLGSSKALHFITYFPGNDTLSVVCVAHRWGADVAVSHSGLGVLPC